MKLHRLSGLLLSLLIGTSPLFAQAINVTTTGVGIGTATPSYKLHINGSPAINAASRANFALEDPTGQSAGVGPGISFRAINNAAGTYWDAAGIKGIKENSIDGNSAGALCLLTSTSGGVPMERVRVNGIGNMVVGSSISQPENKLTIGPIDSLEGGQIALLPGSGASYSCMWDIYMGSMRFMGGDANGTSNKMLMEIPLATGYVGIGTGAPTHKLTVNGQVKSKGFITDTTNWSDYVFAPDYRLTSLEEVEAHIKEKKHLPGIPSESELVEKGLDLGAMSAAQMAQIEQLMLHVIEMNKKLKAQGEEIQQLKAAMGAKGSLGTGVNGKL